MSAFTARELAWVVSTARETGRDVLTEGVLYVGEGSVQYRPLTAHELKMAERYIRRAERQTAYEIRRVQAETRRLAYLARCERAAYDEDRLRTSRVAMARVAAASGLV